MKRTQISLIDKPLVKFLLKNKNSELSDIRKHLEKLGLIYAKNSKGLETRLKVLIDRNYIIKKRKNPFDYPTYMIGKKGLQLVSKVNV